jgi:hypothetical protein
MPRARLTVVALSVFVLASGAALADEIIHFENGTHLPIRSHTVKDGMVHVVMGSNASMAFPTSMIDRIERGGKLIYDPSVAVTNQAVKGEDRPEIPGTVSLDSAPTPRSFQAGTSAPASSRRKSASSYRAAMMARDPAELLRMRQQMKEGPQAPESQSVFPGSASESRRKVSEVRSLSSPGLRNASPVLENAHQKVRTKAPRITSKPLPDVLAPVPPPSDPAADPPAPAGDGAGEATQGGSGESDN